MSDDLEVAKGSVGLKIVAWVGTGVVALTVTFFSPLIKKKGEDLAGVSFPDQAGKPPVIVVQSPVPAEAGATRSPDAPGGGGRCSNTSCVGWSGGEGGQDAPPRAASDPEHDHGASV